MADTLFTTDSGAPLYQQIVDYYVRGINSGMFSPGQQLPTVRAYSAERNIAMGTVKHAYDILAQLGYVEKEQGRGTFVADIRKESGLGKKEQAMAAIDAFLDKMYSLSFSPDAIRIYLDLKLREREGQPGAVRIGAVDCCPETLFALSNEIGGLDNVEVYEYPLEPVINAPHDFRPPMDLIVTSAVHYQDLLAKMPPGSRVFRLVITISRATLIALARIPAGSKIGVIAVSERFLRVVLNACKEWGVLSQPPVTAFFGDTAAVEAAARQSDQLIVPADYLRYCNSQEQALLLEAAPLGFGFNIEKGSLLTLEEEVAKILEQKQQA